jgi:hypothetical protein
VYETGPICNRILIIVGISALYKFHKNERALFGEALMRVITRHTTEVNPNSRLNNTCLFMRTKELTILIVITSQFITFMRVDLWAKELDLNSK